MEKNLQGPKLAARKPDPTRETRWPAVQDASGWPSGFCHLQWNLEHWNDVVGPAGPVIKTSRVRVLAGVVDEFSFPRPTFCTVTLFSSSFSFFRYPFHPQCYCSSTDHSAEDAGYR